jgi:hypothetical protein
MPSPSQTPIGAASASSLSANDKKKKKQKSASVPNETKTNSVKATIPDPPAKTKFAGPDLDIEELFKHPKSFQNINEKDYLFSTNGKIHKLLDRDGHEVTFLIVGVISVAHVGKYGNYNEVTLIITLTLRNMIELLTVLVLLFFCKL